MNRLSFGEFARKAKVAQQERRQKSAKRTPQPERLPPGQVIRNDPGLGKVKRLIRDKYGRLVLNPLFESISMRPGALGSAARTRGPKLDAMGKPIKPPSPTFDPRFAHLRKQAIQQSQQPTPAPEPTQQKPKEYIQKWIPNFPPPKELKVKSPPKVKLPLKKTKTKTPKQKTRQLSLKLKEFYLSFKHSLS